VKHFKVNDDKSVVVGLDNGKKEHRESSNMLGRLLNHIKQASEPPLVCRSVSYLSIR